jgi:hypothetical protein
MLVCRVIWLGDSSSLSSKEKNCQCACNLIDKLQIVTH